MDREVAVVVLQDGQSCSLNAEGGRKECEPNTGTEQTTRNALQAGNRKYGARTGSESHTACVFLDGGYVRGKGKMFPSNKKKKKKSKSLEIASSINHEAAEHIMTNTWALVDSPDKHWSLFILTEGVCVAVSVRCVSRDCVPCHFRGHAEDKLNKHAQQHANRLHALLIIPKGGPQH